MGSFQTELTYDNEYYLPSGTSILRVVIPGLPYVGGDMIVQKIRIRYTMCPQDENVETSNYKISKASIVDMKNCNAGGGCPYVFVNSEEGFIQDNNILHRSEFDENIGNDIEDKYLLRISPDFNQFDSTCSLKIKELNNDISHFDKFQLAAIDHPSGTNLGITERNDYVLYFPSIASSPEYAEHNGENVTNELNYDSNYTKSVQGEDGDNVTGSFGASEKNSIKTDIKKTLENSLKGINKTLLKNKRKDNRDKFPNLNDNGLDDSVAVMIDPSESDYVGTIGPPAKGDAGKIEAHEEGRSSNVVNYIFAKRQNTSPVIMPVGKHVNIDSVFSTWYSDFKITYLAVTPVYYGGYIENTLDFIEAVDSLNGNVLTALLNEDQNYAIMDSTSDIILKFKILLEMFRLVL